MSIGDSLCDTCKRKHPAGFAGVIGNMRVFLCRECAGRVCQLFLRYIRGFDRRKPRPKRPRNPQLPIIDNHGTVRCRKCEVQIDGRGPFCVPCSKAPDVGSRLSADGGQPHRPELTQGSAVSTTNPAGHDQVSVGGHAHATPMDRLPHR